MKPKLRLRGQIHHPVNWRGGVLSLKFIKRFWARVDKTPTCWLWKHTKDKYGYGTIKANGEKRRAHRLSFILMFGDIAENKWVLHKCDVRHCVNPEHLYLGTAKDNAEDRQQRNPQLGESHGRAKFTAKQILKIRQLSKKGKTPKELAGNFRSSPQNIRHIVSNQSWAHI